MAGGGAEEYGAFWQYVSDDADRGYAHFRLRLGEPGDGKDRHLYNRHLYAQAAYSPFELVGVARRRIIDRYRCLDGNGRDFLHVVAHSATP